jgi:4-hydroxyacetophenone monooxygenase
MSGLVAAHRLRQAGLDVTVLEKNDDVGGTWFENTYPGCRVDVSNHFYSYSFAQRVDWPDHFSPQGVLLDYFRTFADENGLRPLIRFGTEVTSVVLDEPAMTWRLTVTTPAGTEETVEAEAVVSAVGQLNRPNMPDLPGIDDFAGPWFHSARWRHDVDLRGKRVAVIGTGASAAQFIPEVAKEAAHLTVFQRTPAWFLPTPNYHDPVDPAAQWLFRNIPGYANWYRYFIFWQNVEGVRGAAVVDPDWDHGEESVSLVNDGARQILTAYIHLQFADMPELLPHVVPQYPPFAKRFIRDNGAWAEALRRDNVDLVTTGIAGVTAGGVATVDGEVHEADVIVYGTGFTASDFLMPMRVVGRGGVELHERWKGDARALLGITLPQFPNLFLLYGPNTNIVVNGSITYFSECEVHYVVGCLRELLARGARALEPTEEAHDAYNERIDAQNALMAWGASKVNSWYKNATGRSAQNWPFSLLEYWQLTREPDLSQYLLHDEPRR